MTEVLWFKEMSSNPVRKYDELLATLDRRFQSVHARYPYDIACGDGCAACCHGLFDVSLPDARRIVRGYAALPPPLQDAVAERALRLQDRILGKLPELSSPYLLDASDQNVQDRIDAMTELMPEARCIFLDDGDRCLIYDDRPMACRLEGLPMIDRHDGLFDDWCEKNFKEGIAPETSSELMAELQLDYYAMQELEQMAAMRLVRLFRDSHPTGKEAPTVLIPSIIAAYADFQRLALPSVLGTS